MKILLKILIMFSFNNVLANDVLVERKKLKAYKTLDQVELAVEEGRSCVDKAETKVEVKTCIIGLRNQIKNLKKKRN